MKAYLKINVVLHLEGDSTDPRMVAVQKYQLAHQHSGVIEVPDVEKAQRTLEALQRAIDGAMSGLSIAPVMLRNHVPKLEAAFGGEKHAQTLNDATNATAVGGENYPVLQPGEVDDTGAYPVKNDEGSAHTIKVIKS